MTNPTRLLIALLVALAGTIVSGTPSHAAKKSTAARPPSGKVLRIRLPFEPSTLDWNLGDVPIAVIQNTMRGLYRVNSGGKTVPDLVESADVLDGGKRWVFHLRSDVRWSDGVPFRAQHAVDSLRRLLDPATASSYAYFLYDIEGAVEFNKDTSRKVDPLGIRHLSDLSFEVRLKHPAAYLPAILTHWVTFPIRSDLVRKIRDYWLHAPKIVTLGAYQIVEWRPQVRIVMTPNPYAQPAPWFSRVEAWIVTDDATAYNLYQTGHLDFMSDPGPNARKHPDLIRRVSPILYFLGIGPGHPLLSKRAGVLALSAALDRTQLPGALDGPHRPTLDFCPPELARLVGGLPENNAPTESPRALLKKAGYANGSRVPPLKLLYFNRPLIKQLAEWIQDQWKKNLDLRVELESHDAKNYWTELARNAQPLFINSKGASYPDPDAYFRLFTSDNPQNLGRWVNPAYEREIEQAQRSLSNSERRRLYTAASRRLLDEQPGMIPLFFRATDYLVKPYLQGVEINPLTSVYFQSASYSAGR